MERALALHVIASGSHGNAVIVENLLTHEGVLIDCGTTKKALFAGCEAVGFDRTRIAAVLLTHEHTDHTKGLGVRLRGLAKDATFPTLYVNDAVAKASSDVRAIADTTALAPLELDAPFTVAGIGILPFQTSHDAAFSCGFRFEAAGDAIGYVADTGVITGAAHEALQNVRVLAMEANHDLDMLAHGPYPVYVQRRIASDHGHLSNDQAKEELGLLLSDNLRDVVSLHVSQNNNAYRLPVAGYESVIEGAGLAGAVRVHSSYQSRPVSI